MAVPMLRRFRMLALNLSQKLVTFHRLSSLNSCLPLCASSRSTSGRHRRSQAGPFVSGRGRSLPKPRDPALEYLAVLETTHDEFQTHADNVATGVAPGLVSMYASVYNEDEWDRFK